MAPMSQRRLRLDVRAEVEIRRGEISTGDWLRSRRNFARDREKCRRA
jgi:hypothetical protein